VLASSPRVAWSDRSTSRLLSLTLVAGAYFVGAKLSLRLAYLHPSASPVWPPTGFALGVLLVLGCRAWPAIWTGAFLANLTTAGSLATSLGIALGNTAEALAGAFLVNRFAGGRHAMNGSWNIFKFAVLAAGASTTMSATFGVASLAADGFVEPGTHGMVWLTWWLGDVVGALMVAPLVLLWSEDWRLRWSLAQAGEALLILLAIVTTGILMFGGLLPPYPVTFLCPPLLLWPAFRLGPREAATSAAVLAVIAVAGTLRGFGPFLGGSRNESLLLLQSFMGVSTLTAIAVAAVVAERKRLEARLLHLADYDSLTEVLSRRRFKEELAHQLAKSMRYDTPAALLFVDLDEFKSINDRLGHAGGDRILSSVARLLRGRLRDSDVMGRLGGDEFAVLLPRADRPQASAVADMLLKAIGSHATVVDGRTIIAGASIGIALIPEHGTSAEQLLAHADAAMFAAKGAGGNRCRIYTPDSETPESGPRRDERSRRR
jgi:diguanylate cyclase (GGDEF)-like protein